MSTYLTEFLLRVSLFPEYNCLPTSRAFAQTLEQNQLTSEQLLNHIYECINAPENEKPTFPCTMSLSSDETTPLSSTKCNCKKSKCLKLYCECFSKGSFCKDCNCECCQNTESHTEARAKAIDQMMARFSLPFGCRTASMKGCNCKKTGCQKKYCECYNSGLPCNEYCKCMNCANC